MTKTNGHKPPLVEVLPLTAVLPDDRNVNRHTQRGQKLVEQSLRQRGAFRSIAAAGKTRGKPVVKAGSLTLQAAIDAGFTEAIHVHTQGDQLVVVVRDDIAPDSAEAALLGIEDNHAAHASYDPDAAMLAQLAREEEAVLAYVQDDRELAALLRQADNGAGGDAEPQVDRVKARVKVGDVWRLGRHFVACIDSLNRVSILALLNGAIPVFVWADPPYGIDIV